MAFCLAVSLSFGCRKRTEAPAKVSALPEHPEATSPAPARSTPNTALAPAPVPVGAPGVDRIEDRIPTAPPNSSKNNPVDRTLTEALQRYNEANGKMPMDFSVLVTAKYLKALPTPPPGKIYALDRPHMQVVLLSQ